MGTNTLAGTKLIVSLGANRLTLTLLNLLKGNERYAQCDEFLAGCHKEVYPRASPHR